jgi:hypothetical protein
MTVTLQQQVSAGQDGETVTGLRREDSGSVGQPGACSP